MTPEQFNTIMARLDSIERQLDPARSVSNNEKAKHLKRAIATGDRGVIRQAVKDINKRPVRTRSIK